MYAWNQKYRAVKKELPQILLVLLYIAVVNDRVSFLKDLPFFGGVAPDVVHEDDSIASAAASSSDLVVKNVKQSSAGFDALRRARFDNFLFMASIIANRTNTKLAAAICIGSEPFEEDTRQMMTKTTTRIGCKQHFIDQAKRKSDETLQKTFAVLGDKGALAELGLLNFGQVFRGWSAKEDQMVAEVLISYITKTVANEIEHSSLYCMRPPHRFFQYLSDDVADKKEVMEWCKVIRGCFGLGLFGDVMNLYRIVFSHAAIVLLIGFRSIRFPSFSPVEPPIVSSDCISESDVLIRSRFLYDVGNNLLMHI